MYFGMLAPWSLRRYRLTNRRLIIEKGPKFKVDQYVDFDRFDAIDIDVRLARRGIRPATWFFGWGRFKLCGLTAWDIRRHSGRFA